MSRNPEEPVYNRIEEARTNLGLSRQELADKVGVHYQTIGYLEREEVSELFSQTPFKKGK
jgi:DNA-binding XRE family transcriptional regulator